MTWQAVNEVCNMGYICVHYFTYTEIPLWYEKL